MTRGHSDADTRIVTDADFRQLVDAYKDKVYNTVLGLVQNNADAEDLAQEVFIKVFEKLPSFRGESSVSTWIYRIAVTTSLDHLRSRKRRARFSFLQMFSSEKETETAKDFDHPGVLAEKKEDARQLFKAMNALPDNQKTAFVLQKTEGLTQTEIAAIMNISEGAVESLLSRAKQNLKKLLTEYYRS